MGTRRSKHHKGRKPRYKDYQRTALSDLEPKTVSRLEREAEIFLDERQNSKWRGEDMLRSLRNKPLHSMPSSSAPLTEIVKAYLQKRKMESDRKEVVQAFPSQKKLPEHVHLPFLIEQEASRFSFSNDVLLELYRERKISGRTFHAGRQWQADYERATIQPNRSINWEAGRLGYQQRGDLSNAQWAAMNRRHKFASAASHAAAAFLDFCLEPDRGVEQLLSILHINDNQLANIFINLLMQARLCLDTQPHRQAETRQNYLEMAL